MALTFIWPGLNKLNDPSGIGQMIQTIGSARFSVDHSISKKRRIKDLKVCL